MGTSIHLDERERANKILDLILSEWKEWRAYYKRIEEQIEDAEAKGELIEPEEDESEYHEKMEREHRARLRYMNSLRLVDALVSSRSTGRFPWPTFHAQDLSDVLEKHEEKEDLSRDELVHDINAFLEQRKSCYPIGCKLPMRLPKTVSYEDFDKTTGICGVSATKREWSTEVVITGYVMPSVRASFAQAIQKILRQAYVLSQMEECVPQRRWIPTPRHPTGGLPAEVEDDGYLFSGYTKSNKKFWTPSTSVHLFLRRILNQTDLGEIEEADAKRFDYLLQDIVFRPAIHNPGNKREKREDVIRQSVWHLAQLAGIGPSMLALIGYMAIFERCISCLKFDCKDFRNYKDDRMPIAKRIAQKLELDDFPSDRLETLFSERHKSIHELRDSATHRDVNVAWSLAKTAVHHLVAKVTETQAHGERPGGRNTVGHDITRAVKKILSKLLLWEFNLGP